MKRMLIVLCAAVAVASLVWAAYRATSPPETALTKFVPAGPLLYLEAKDFSSFLSDWNSSPQKRIGFRATTTKFSLARGCFCA